MSPGADIKRVEILREINSSLNEFSQTLSSQLKSIQSEINRTLDWLAEKERYWRNKVQSCASAVRQAEREYAICVSQPPDDRGIRPNCGSEAAALAAARRELENSQRELNNALEWKRGVEEKVSAYVGQATKMQRTANTTLSQASSFLLSKARELGYYGQIQPPTPIKVIGQRGALYERAKQQMLLHALDDPSVSRDIKGWIRNELRRVKLGQADRMRMPGISHNRYDVAPLVPSLDAGHRMHDVHHWSNLRFEDVWINRTRYHRAIRLGLGDRYR